MKSWILYVILVVVCYLGLLNNNQPKIALVSLYYFPCHLHLIFTNTAPQTTKCVVYPEFYSPRYN